MRETGDDLRCVVRIGGFVRLDALLPTALMECIPGDIHLLRQDIKKAKTEQRQVHERNITGRQVLMMVYRFSP